MSLFSWNRAMSIRQQVPRPQLPRTHYFLTISHGVKMRTLAVPRWGAHVSLALVPVLLTWTAGVSLYIGLHDQILAGIMAQRSRMQLAYENRLANLHARLDQATSHTLLDQQSIARKIAALSQRETMLEQRATLLSSLSRFVDHRPTGSIARPGGAADATGAPGQGDAVWGKPKPESMLLPRDIRGPDMPQSTHQVLAALQRVKINEDTDTINQLTALKQLAGPAAAAAGRLNRAIRAAGLDPAQLRVKPVKNIGGPFIPLDKTEGNSHFGHEIAAVKGSLVQIAKLRRLMHYLPLSAPLPGHLAITSPFGMRLDPFLDRMSLHPGIDFHQAFGSPIHATGAGKVVIARYWGGYGNMVEIDHGDGIMTRYGHMSRLNVAEGQHVLRGQVLGYIGSTGRSTGPHLHYEVRLNGVAVNPAPFLRAGTMLAAADLR
ncbi:MAG: M23 family metallopeptidase [Hyphomicrobiales bacterium]|nr:M23 family metallopeptidase [Hyphomicrobiales bacterium]